MRKISLFLCVLFLGLINVNASECLDYEKEVTLNNHSYCFSLSIVSEDLFNSTILSDYSMDFTSDKIDIDASNLSIEEGDLLQLYLYDPNKLAFSSFSNTKTSDGTIFKITHEYSSSFNFSYEYNIYEDISCIDDTNNYDNCNLVASIKPVVNISINEEEKETEDDDFDDTEIELFKEDSDSGSNFFLVLGGGIIFLFAVVAVAMILIKKYY